RTGTQLSGQPGASYVKSLKKTADSYTLMQLRDAFADCGKLRFGLSATRSCGGAGPNCLWRRAATGAADQVFPDASSSRAAYMPAEGVIQDAPSDNNALANATPGPRLFDHRGSR